MSFADEASITVPTSMLMNQLGLLLQAKAEYAEAEPLFRRAVSIFHTSLGAAHPSTSGVQGNYRRLLKELGLTESEIEERLREFTP